jgi:hypothetical protein
MSHGLSSHVDSFDLYGSEMLPVSMLSTVVFPPFFLENNDFPFFVVLDNPSRDGRS